MTATRSGIPTFHQNTQFRSRLEARWAAFFEWSWVYEPLDADGYIPDFLLTGAHPTFVEVGPCITKQDYEAKTAKGDKVASQPGHDLLVVGVSPLPDIPMEGSGDVVIGWLGEFFEGFPSHEPGNGCGCAHEGSPKHVLHGFPCRNEGDHPPEECPTGYVFDAIPAHDPMVCPHCDHAGEPAGYGWAGATWGSCGCKGHSLSFYHAYGSCTHRPCAGAHEEPIRRPYPWGSGIRAPEEERIEALWREAGNAVQWQPKP